MEVAQGIHRIEAPLGDRFVCLYLLVGDDGALIVDTGLDETPRASLVPYLDALHLAPEQIRYVVITHADLDHMGGNASLKALTPNALFLCHDLDRLQIENIDRMIAERYSEFAADHGIDDSAETKAWTRANARGVPIDLSLTGGEKIRLAADWQVEILHTAGHSRGHLSIHDPRSRSLIIADASLWNAVLRKDGTPAFPPTYRYVETYLASIQRFQGMDVDTLLTSHYPVCTGRSVAEFLGESRAFVDRVDAALQSELRRSTVSLTTRELIESLSPRLGQWPDAAAQNLAFPLVGHLEQLDRYGRIAAERRDGRIVWRWRD